MNLNQYNTKNYENKRNWTLGQNKPISNPIRQACVVCEGLAGLIKPNLRKDKMNVNLTLTKDHRKKDDFSVRINKPNSQNAKNERKVIYYRGL